MISKGKQCSAYGPSWRKSHNTVGVRGEGRWRMVVSVKISAVHTTQTFQVSREKNTFLVDTPDFSSCILMI